MRIHTSVFFEPNSRTYVEKGATLEINTQTGKVQGISFTPEDQDEVTIEPGDIGLRDKFVMPGLVDSHTHIFLHDYSERSPLSQMRDESAVERIARATTHLRLALAAGYTTYRDLGTEALYSADIGIRNAVARGILPGPRLFVATEAVASSGSYEVRVESRDAGLKPPRASDSGDGVDGVRAAVRRRIGDGADVIKFYADYRRQVMRFPADACFPGSTTLAQGSTPLFDEAEMRSIVAEAHRAGLPVAAHAGEARTAVMAVKAGVDTVEHVFADSHSNEDGEGEGKEGEAHANVRAFIREISRGPSSKRCIWVPTLAVIEKIHSPRDGDGGSTLATAQEWVRHAVGMGAVVAAGGDTGAFSHGLNARELELLRDAGLSVEDVMVAGTYNGWMACGGDRCGYRFGFLEPGVQADIVALETDPRRDRFAFRKVSFVMKDGRVYKRDGVMVNMEPSMPRFPGVEGQQPREEEEEEVVVSQEDNHQQKDLQNTHQGNKGSPSYSFEEDGSEVIMIERRDLVGE